MWAGASHEDLGGKWEKNGFQGNSKTTTQIFTNNPSFYSKFHDQHFPNYFLKNVVSHGDWDLVHRFGANGPKIGFLT